MYKYLSLLCLLTGCVSSTYTKVDMSPLEADKAKCEYETERDLALRRNSFGTFIREAEMVRACMKAKGYSDGQ